MGRRHDVSSIDLKVIEVEFFSYGVYIAWESDIGLGVYTIYTIEDNNSKLVGESECMDSNEDKDFLKLLLKLASEWIIERIDIRE